MPENKEARPDGTSGHKGGLLSGIDGWIRQLLERIAAALPVERETVIVELEGGSYRTPPKTRTWTRLDVSGTARRVLLSPAFRALCIVSPLITVVYAGLLVVLDGNSRLQPITRLDLGFLGMVDLPVALSRYWDLPFVLLWSVLTGVALSLVLSGVGRFVKALYVVLGGVLAVIAVSHSLFAGGLIIVAFCLIVAFLGSLSNVSGSGFELWLATLIGGCLAIGVLVGFVVATFFLVAATVLSGLGAAVATVIVRLLQSGNEIGRS